MTHHLVDVRINGSREMIRAQDEAQLLYLLVTLLAPSGPQETHLPLNLCLVIDHSTSMNGHRLEQLKVATAEIIDKLAAEDVLSVIAFSDRANVILPVGRTLDRARLVSRVSRIRASGGTEIFQGLSLGVTEMRKVSLSSHANHLILLTDGHTYGDVEACLELAERSAAKGIDISAFGIGAEWNEEFLDDLTTPSGGETVYITSPSQVAVHLQQKVKGFGVVYGRNLRLVNDLPAGLELKTLFKVAPFAQPLIVKGRHLRVGFVEERTPLSLLLEIIIGPQLAGRRVSIPLNFMVDIPSMKLVDQVIKRDYEIAVVAHDPGISSPEDVSQAVQAWNFYRMNELAWDDLEAGRVEQATTRLRRLTQRLHEAGESNLAQEVASEAERLVRTGTISTSGRKTLKFGTRALVTQTIPTDEKNNDNL
jgi:Ca-activated chloride channel family protein